MATKADLIDLDHCCELRDQSAMIEIVQEGELNLHFLTHPDRGYLTAIQAENAVLIVFGEHVDLGERSLQGRRLNVQTFVLVLDIIFADDFAFEATRDHQALAE